MQDSVENVLPSPMGFNFTTLSYGDILSQWKFNGDGTDSSGNGNVFNALDFMGPADLYVTDVVHEGTGSLYLNGGLQYGTSNINLGNQLTVAVWVNVDNSMQGDINTIMADTDTGEASNGFKLCINRWGATDRAVMIEVGNGSTGGKWITADGLIQPGNWYHLAFVIDQPNQSIKIYYNGAEAPLTFVSDEHFTQDQFSYSFNTSGPFTIGAFPRRLLLQLQGSPRRHARLQPRSLRRGDRQNRAGKVSHFLPSRASSQCPALFFHRALRPLLSSVLFPSFAIE